MFGLIETNLEKENKPTDGLKLICGLTLMTVIVMAFVNIYYYIKF